MKKCVREYVATCMVTKKECLLDITPLGWVGIQYKVCRPNTFNSQPMWGPFKYGAGAVGPFKYIYLCWHLELELELDQQIAQKSKDLVDSGLLVNELEQWFVCNLNGSIFHRHPFQFRAAKIHGSWIGLLKPHTILLLYWPKKNLILLG